jgi:hydroxybutyrate-dimer hydrolase
VRRRVGQALVFSACVASAGVLASSLEPGRVTEVSRRVLDGSSDDLLTAGLGLEGLRSPLPPIFADPLRPTTLELRRRAIHAAWRGLIDLSPDGGAGRLFGPRPGERIAGVERHGALRLDDSPHPDSIMLQVPSSFDPAAPCLVAVASSGSRGIYGALPTAGEWGLRQGCAVVTSDKGTGNGFFDPVHGTAIRLDGVVTRDRADPLVGFRTEPRAPDGERPIPWLLSKHAHSGSDPEPRWGERLIAATRIAFEWLNEEYRGRLAQPITPANTTVIASGISNGGGAVLRALELDRGSARRRLFDGAVVAEPNVTVAAVQPRLLLQGGVDPAQVEVRGLLDYATLHGLLQPCAVLAERDPSAPLAAVTAASRSSAEAWCSELAAGGDLEGADADARARDARDRLLAAGAEPGALRLGHLNVQAQLWLSVATTYLHAHAGAGIDEQPCGLGFAALDASGRPRVLSAEEWARLFSDGVGIAPTAGIAIHRAEGAPAASVQTLRCLRGWVDSALRGDAVPVAEGQRVRADFAARLKAGLQSLEMKAEPGRRPVIVIHGRLDGLVPANHSSRPWYLAARRRESRAELRYYEIQHGQHFDAFLALPGFASAFVPMQPHLLAAMDLMAARLRGGASLPPSQVVRSRPRAPASGPPAPLERVHAGRIEPAPGASDRIEPGRDGILVVPE